MANVTAPAFHNLLPPSFKSQVAAWLAEDIPSFDPAGVVVGTAPRRAVLWAKSPGVLAGVPFFDEVMAQCSCAVRWEMAEGSELFPKSEPEMATETATVTPDRIRVATVEGPANRLLQAERVALNVLARCSGVATASARLVSLATASGGGDGRQFSGQVAGTRKTTPGFRAVEKYGMLVGGADTHRMDLSSMVMLKDNHIWSRGSIREAVRAARAVAGFSLKVEVEVRTEAEADEAIDEGADVIMLDNFTPEAVRPVAETLRLRWRHRRQFLLEVSGGVTEDNIANYAAADVDIISTSALHQGVPHVNFSLKIET